MPDDKKATTSSQAPETPPVKFKPVKFIHQKNFQYRIFHADSVWSTINGFGNVQLDFCVEYPPRPSSVIQPVKEDGNFTGEQILEGVDDGVHFGIVRDFQCGVVLSLATAIQLYEVKSVETDVYNCIAFSAGDETRKWWPDADFFCHWPIQMREETIECFIKMYESLGYYKCRKNSPRYNPFFEKIAIYFDPVGTPWWPPNFPTHAAIQTSYGVWKSKLGDLEDIEHLTLECLNGSDPNGRGACYGRPIQIMKKRRPIITAICGFFIMLWRRLVF